MGIQVNGKSAVLQAPDSAVRLHVPKGLYAFIMGHVHTEAKPFHHVIPDGECLVSPIVEYLYISKQEAPKNTWFMITVPHCLEKNDINTIKVRHGDIHKNIPFMVVPSKDCYFEVDEEHITIFARHFSQFICTSCKKVCHGQAKVFIFGSTSPSKHRPRTSALRSYACSPLFRIIDFKMVSTQFLKMLVNVTRFIVQTPELCRNPSADSMP